jgi:hypothetical protein
MSSKDTSHRPQFITVLPPDSMEKMVCGLLLQCCLVFHSTLFSTVEMASLCSVYYVTL